MGSNPSYQKTSPIEYALKSRPNQLISFEIFDDFPYPANNNSKTVNFQFEEIIKNCILTEYQQETIKNITPDFKWKLICKHRYYLLTNQDTLSPSKSITTFFTKSLKSEDSLFLLDKFWNWLKQSAKEKQIESLIKNDILEMLFGLLDKCNEICLVTRNFHKQTLILKIINHLCKQTMALEKCIDMPDSGLILLRNLDFENWENSKLILTLLNDFCWKSDKGYFNVTKNIEKLAYEKQLKSKFEEFFKVLSENSNVILVESVLAFMNSLVDSGEHENERIIIRSEMMSSDIKKVFEIIKEKINSEQYLMEDCNYDNYIRFCKHKLRSEDQMLTSLSPAMFFDKEQNELFQNKIQSILNQIEIFEKGWEEYMEEFCSDESEDVNHQKNRNNNLDLTDIDNLFQRMKSKSLGNSNYANLLSVIQSLSMIPHDEKGSKTWSELKEILVDLQGKHYSEKLQNLNCHKDSSETNDNIEELNSQIVFLNSQINLRDEEIQKLLKKSETLTAQYQKEKAELSLRLKFAQSRMLESQVRSGSISREKSDKIKFLETKVKELIKSPEKTDPKSLLFRVRQLEEENKNLTQELCQLRNQMESQELKLPLDLIDQTQYIEQLKSRVSELESAVEASLQDNGMSHTRPLSRNNSNQSFKPSRRESIKIQSPIQRQSVVSFHLKEVAVTPRSIITIYDHKKQKNNLTFESIIENIEESTGSLCFIPPPNQLFPPSPTLPPPPPPPPPLPRFSLFLNGHLLLPNLNELNTSNEPRKEKKKPKVPMKQICWNPITKRDVKGTIWETITDEDVIYDPVELEKLFTSKRQITEKIQNAIQIKPNQKINLLTSIRNKNISIALHRLKLSLPAITESLMNFDSKILTMNNVSCLLQACPKEEEFVLLENFEGDKEMLDLPEKFVLALSKVPGCRLRLEGYQFYLTYKELVEDFSLKTERLIEIFEKILEDERLHRLLQYTLAIGNFFNGQGERGGAIGFKLDVFDRIVDIKTSDGKRSCLSFLIELIENNTREAFISSSEDLSLYDMGRRLSIAILQTALQDIKKGQQIIQSLLQLSVLNQENIPPIIDKIEEIFGEFFLILEKNIDEMEIRLEEVTDTVKKCIQYYGEDEGEELVEKVWRIWTACKKAKTENEKEREKRKKEEAKIKREEEKKLKMEVKNKLENPEELASYITNRRKLRRREAQELRINQYKRTSIFSRGSMLSVCPSDMERSQANM